MVEQILDFWFGSEPTEKSRIWFNSDDDLDTEIRSKFESTLDEAIAGKLDSWLDDPESCLAFIILTDQFPRNMYRDQSRAFASDKISQQACLQGIQKDFVGKQTNSIRSWFFLMPLMHAEDLMLQKLSVLNYRKLLESSSDDFQSFIKSALDHAIRHHDEITRFGRFPYRNRALDRDPSPEEIKYVESLMRS